MAMAIDWTPRFSSQNSRLREEQVGRMEHQISYFNVLTDYHFSIRHPEAVKEILLALLDGKQSYIADFDKDIINYLVANTEEALNFFNKMCEMPKYKNALRQHREAFLNYNEAKKLLAKQMPISDFVKWNTYNKNYHACFQKLQQCCRDKNLQKAYIMAICEHDLILKPGCISLIIDRKQIPVSTVFWRSNREGIHLMMQDKISNYFESSKKIQHFLIDADENIELMIESKRIDIFHSLDPAISALEEKNDDELKARNLEKRADYQQFLLNGSMDAVVMLKYCHIMELLDIYYYFHQCVQKGDDNIINKSIFLNLYQYLFGKVRSNLPEGFEQALIPLIRPLICLYYRGKHYSADSIFCFLEALQQLGKKYAVKHFSDQIITVILMYYFGAGDKAQAANVLLSEQGDKGMDWFKWLLYVNPQGITPKDFSAVEQKMSDQHIDKLFKGDIEPKTAYELTMHYYINRLCTALQQCNESEIKHLIAQGAAPVQDSQMYQTIQGLSFQTQAKIIPLLEKVRSGYCDTLLAQPDILHDNPSFLGRLGLRF